MKVLSGAIGSSNEVELTDAEQFANEQFHVLLSIGKSCVEAKRIVQELNTINNAVPDDSLFWEWLS